MVSWRSRVNVSGVVMPSPVGVAMLWLRYPGPPKPSEASDEALLTKIVVFITRAMRVTASTSLE